MIEEILKEIAETQRANTEKHQHAARDAHAKSHAVLKASLTVNGGPPPRLAQGVFATPRRYDVVVRMSSSPGDIHSERVPAPPGFAVTIIGVDGERLLPGLKNGNQDFPMVNFPTLAFGTIQQYKRMLPRLEKNAQSPEVLQKLVAGTGTLARKASEGVGRDNSHVLGETYYTQAAVRYGDYVAKISLVPRSNNVRALTDRRMDVNDFSSIRDLVVDHFRTESAEYEPDAQLCMGLDTMPVEDTTVSWDENASPNQPIATLRLEPQDAYGAARRDDGDDLPTFNPWDGVLAHQPLGSIMRVRKDAYERSTAFRHSENARPRVEPDGIDQIPD
ncbi:catalase [Arthrobacter echini]|uniref:Catalase n=1 Tax=Arthrobacter echini TaxID=1529066 RepID=A0A4S5E5P3_9MICC|nr:catalase [Arthrobacter echini]